ncbi:phage portal protein [Pimelobacter simplex]|uniref:phage portal protein n=1 Tax=Nocardioides simplex TaxID=2045 RepID=UPI0021502399|nr:phage portal protein [Pimelobacter simplex]UUW87408.1 phage portal protein [Pimelobacter simplex]UUW96913.1 phage portal protein [Pimelobacter simplex]
MRLSERLVQRKSFTQPSFWSNGTSSWGAPFGDKEQIGNDFEGYIAGAFKDNGVVFSCMLARMMLFSEARFAFRRFRDGQPRSLFTTGELALLERPWPGGTTGDLLGRMLQDADMAGNAYHTTVDDEGRYGRAAVGSGRRIARLRPDWTSIVLGSRSGNLRDIDTRPIGYLYAPPEAEKVLLLPDEVSHFSPIPDPAARFRGMSWLTPVLREVKADKAATKHKLKFFEQGATISTVVSLDKDITPEAFDEFVARMKANTEGVDNAYKTLYLGGGADVTLTGSSMKELDFKATQGAGETRIASAAGVHPVVVGLSEGLAGSSLNAGNFEAAIRFTADKTIRPLWRNAAGSLERLLKSPGPDASLWYDDRDVAFLSDNTKDVAEIQSKQAATAKSLLDGGFTPESVVEFLDTGSLTVLEHSGLYSVQLQAPGTRTPASQTSPEPSPEEA